MEELLAALILTFTDPVNLALLLSACLLSFSFGILPGLTGTEAMIILLPFTYRLDMYQSLIMLSSAYAASGAGSAMTSILYGIPGSSTSLTTILDGYPLRKRGRAVFAISVTSSASIVAGILSLLIVVLLIPFMGPFSMLFGPAELFVFVMLGIVVLSSTGDAPPLRGLMAGGLGLLMGTIGMSEVTGEPRYTFGYAALWGGIPLIAAFVGCYPLCEALWITAKRSGIDVAHSSAGDEASRSAAKGQVREGIVETMRRPDALMLSTVLGWFIGVVPGVGSTLANVLGYEVNRNLFGKKEEFGNGSVRGLIGAEASNNSCVGGALIPTLALGIPGGLGTAVLLSVFLIHGVQPGTNMFTGNLTATWVILLAVAASTVISSGVILFGTWKIIGLILRVPIMLVVPIIVFVSLVSVYLARGNPMDVFFAAILGGLAYLMRLYRFPIITFIIALVLGPIAERSFFQSLSIGRGSYEVFVHSPVSIALWLCIFGSLVYSAAQSVQKMRKRSTAKIKEPA